MPRYFFNIVDPQRVAADSEGTEFPNLRAARQDGEETAREFLITTVQNKDQVDSTWLEIADERGVILETVWLKDLVA
jgi:hypothetical protein